MTKKRALGKGLSALLESASTDITASNQGANRSQTVGAIASLGIDQIEANPFNPRTHFEEDALNDLCKSIQEHGIIQPLTVRKLGRDKYQLISGERRFRASQLAGLTEVPCYIRIANDSTMLEMALVENIQREDLNAIEVALSYQRLIDECNFTQENLGNKLGKSRSNITNYLRLLKLPVKVQIGVREGLISMGHARALVSAGDEKRQEELFTLILTDQLSVRELEDIIKGKGEAKKATKTKAEETEISTVIQASQQYLAEKINAKIAIKANANGKGKLVIDFKSIHDLEKILKELNG
ncbi:chromosome partitioning protein ParB [Putridiphycobacter roseus]|uniref:Chromosome partitioning protein ParB n=1 Tax=Putridiphycobacter roseus TaxID=2219161 RepID=A0A2W1ND25_9FLAO|nr:ParB/RepB/Spo0J family partition protein [Putridiphycobacter roseus]PZE17305.1 chromosome partitioning protein ParB [Putridiphycobacter roseus]